MNLHLFEFFGSEMSGLGKDVFGHCQLANVVKQGSRANGVQLGFIQTEIFSDLYGIGLNSLEVVVGGVILSLDGQGQRFNSAQVQGRNLFGVFLFAFEAIQVGAIRAINPVDDGQHEDGGLPTKQAIDDAHAAGDERSKQVVGKRPQITFFPYANGVAPLGDGDYARDGHGIHGEIGGGSGSQQQRPFEADVSRIVTMENEVCRGDRDGQVGEVEQDLNQSRPRFGAPKRLQKASETAHQESFGIGQVQNADENKKKIRGHGGLNAGEANFEEGGAQSNQHEAAEADPVCRVPMKKSVRQKGTADHQLQDDERDGRPAEKLPVFAGNTPDFLPDDHRLACSVTKKKLIAQLTTKIARSTPVAGQSSVEMARPPPAVRCSGRLLNSLESLKGIGNGTRVRICLKRNPFRSTSTGAQNALRGWAPGPVPAYLAVSSKTAGTSVLA